MVVVRRYAGAFLDIGNADTNPGNIVGVCTAPPVCAQLRWHGLAHGIACFNFGFAIPAGSIITAIRIGGDGIAYSAFFDCIIGQATYPRITMVRVGIGNEGTAGICLNGAVCNNVATFQGPIIGLLGTFTPAILNDNTMNFWYLVAHLLNDGGMPIGNVGFFDCVWVEVTYTPPVAVEALGDGFYFTD